MSHYLPDHQPMRLAYRRVSTAGRSDARQLDGETFDREYTDKASGGTTDRPQLAAMLDNLRARDTVVVHSIDRLARNLADLQSIVTRITDAGASVEFRKESLTFSGAEDSAMSKLLMQMLDAVAEFERSMIRERAAEGRAVAKANGVKFGRKAALTPAQVAQARSERAAGKAVAAIAIDLDVSRQTIYSALQSSEAA